MNSGLGLCPSGVCDLVFCTDFLPFLLQGPGKWEQRRDMELPAIIGRELLVQGAAQV